MHGGVNAYLNPAGIGPFGSGADAESFDCPVIIAT